MGIKRTLFQTTLLLTGVIRRLRLQRENPACPILTLEMLAMSQEQNIRRAVAGNTATPQHVLLMFASDPEEKVCRAAAEAIQKRPPGAGQVNARLLAVQSVSSAFSFE
jgi:hypothetical protein